MITEIELKRYDEEYGCSVTFTLKAGEDNALEFTDGGPTDEGYSYGRELWRLIDGVVILEINRTAQDCDGRSDHYQRLEWNPETDGLNEHGRPVWRNADEENRDYAAEAAGY